ncbi:nuclear transport factor 2 family protein [Ideonella sp. BN130291]|uniref:nuclear transport factor 2 family protein n=1 Tax=Ideonella sp. BN130291 TaxID=3112940 RepID=UPI002E276239|nr:nuclear transport factor 2 family protein [Ideonella sp. BN130291]
MSERLAITQLLQDYFDGLYHCDVERLAQVFHPAAVYACATEGPLRLLAMTEYFAIVRQRTSPASLAQRRTDRIVSIDVAGPVTAMAKVECSIEPKHFTDFLSLVKLGGRWQILAKVFHFEVLPP